MKALFATADVCTVLVSLSKSRFPRTFFSLNCSSFPCLDFRANATSSWKAHFVYFVCVFFFDSNVIWIFACFWKQAFILIEHRVGKEMHHVPCMIGPAEIAVYTHVPLYNPASIRCHCFVHSCQRIHFFSSKLRLPMKLIKSNSHIFCRRLNLL